MWQVQLLKTTITVRISHASIWDVYLCICVRLCAVCAMQWCYYRTSAEARVENFPTLMRTSDCAQHSAIAAGDLRIRHATMVYAACVLAACGVRIILCLYAIYCHSLGKVVYYQIISHVFRLYHYEVICPVRIMRMHWNQRPTLISWTWDFFFILYIYYQFDRILEPHCQNP